jgi:hypothetical protein
MAASQPLSGLTLPAGSVADDLSFVALADLSQVLGEGAADCRVIGGHMVTTLAARWRLGAELHRETGDADLGLPPVVARDRHLPDRLKALGYQQVAGNRFSRTVPGIPVNVTAPHENSHQAIIDVLIPTYTSRARENVRVSDDLITTEVLGLAAALSRQPVTMVFELRRLNGDTLLATLPFPDEVSALVLKSLATRMRNKDTDVADIWRCLEIAFAAGVVPSDFNGAVRTEAAAIARSLFAHRQGAGMATLVDDQHLSRQAADQRFTRLRALSTRVLGPG